MKKTLIAAAVLVALTACNKSLIETPALEGDYGYITFDVSADTEMIETKSYSAVASPDNYNITITENQSSTSKYNGKYSDIPNTGFKVSAGTYTVTAENITEEEAETNNNNFGQLRVKGVNNSVAVDAGKPTTATVNCDIQNTKVTVAYTQAFTDLFKSYSTQLTEDSNDSVSIAAQLRTLDMISSSEAFFNVSESGSVTLKWVLTASTSDENAAKKYYKTFTSKKAQYTTISFDASGSEGSIIVSIYADETIVDIQTLNIKIDPITGEVTENSAVQN